MSALAEAVFAHVFPWMAAPQSEDDSSDGAWRDPRARGEQLSTRRVAEDAEIIDGLRGGDATVYDHVFRMHYTALVGFAFSFLREQARAEEVVGDVFVWIYEHRATLQVTGSVRGYLFAAVRHAALNARRGREREETRYRSMREEWVDGVFPTAPRAADERLIDAESREVLGIAVARALERLPDSARVILALRIHRGLDYDEVAQALGISRVAAKQRFSRAVAALRALLPELLA